MDWKFDVWLDHVEGDEDDFIERFDTLKEAKDEARTQADKPIYCGKEFYVIKYREVFRLIT